MALTGQHYWDVPWIDPVSLNGALRLVVDGTFAGITVSGLTGVTGTGVVGAYVKFAGTVTTTGVATCYIPMPVPAVIGGQAVRVQEMSFSGAKVDGDTGGGVVAGTNTWLTGIGLSEAVATAGSTTIAMTSIYSDTIDRLAAAQSATPTDFSFTGMDVARTAGTKLFLRLEINSNDEAIDFRFYMGDHGRILYTNRPAFDAG